ncbi:MAG: phosphodiester glycosidase family protein [Candidatus Bipolaricaulota bacterium]
MDSGLTRALVLAVFGLAALSAVLLTGGEPVVSLNGQQLDGLEVISTSDGLGVPLKEAARLFGARVDSGRGDGFIVEWGKADSFYVDEKRLTRSGTHNFVDIDYLAEKLGGEVTGSDRSLDVRIPPSQLLAASVRGEEISLNFTKYSTFTRSKSSTERTEIKFFNAKKGDVKEAIDPSPNSTAIRSVHIQQGEQGGLTLVVEHSKGVSSKIKTSRGESGFHFTLDFQPPDDEEAPDGSLVTGRQEFSFNRLRVPFGGRNHTIRYLEVSEWRENYRLLPVVAGGELGSGSSLSRLVKDNLGVAGLNANFFDTGSYYPIGLLVKDGRLISKNWGNRAALGVDYFGRLKFIRPEVDLFLRTPGGKINIDGLNRPAGDDELVAYTAEYGNGIPSGSSSVFVKVREGNLVYRSFSPPSSVGKGETLVVATGGARSKLEPLEKGDEVDYDWSMDPPVSLLRGAVSGGPLLIKGGRNVLALEEEDFTRNSSLVNSESTRSVLATTGDGEILFMVISDEGVSLKELPSLLLGSGLNIENAIAFDGGSSAGITYRDGTRIKSVGGRREIPVGLVLVPRS